MKNYESLQAGEREISLWEQSANRGQCLPPGTKPPSWQHQSFGAVWTPGLFYSLTYSGSSLCLSSTMIALRGCILCEMGMIIIYFIKLFKKLNEIIHAKLAATCLVHNKQSMNVSCHFMHIYVYAYIMSMAFYFLSILTYLFVIIIENITDKEIEVR